MVNQKQKGKKTTAEKQPSTLSTAKEAERPWIQRKTMKNLKMSLELCACHLFIKDQQPVRKDQLVSAISDDEYSEHSDK